MGKIRWTNQILYNDESVQKKLTVMDKWDALLDDERNEVGQTSDDAFDAFNDMLEFDTPYVVELSLTKETQSLEELQQELKVKNQEAKEIQVKINELLKKTQVTCRGCGVTHEINQLTYIQSHWYVHPYSCTGGDYWNQGEGGWRCPLCRTHHRLYDKPEIEKLKRFFKDVENKYKD